MKRNTKKIELRCELENLEQRRLLSAPGHSANLYAPHAMVRGESSSAWTADWWKWVLSFPVSSNPDFDTTGASGSVGDVGKVFFLGGTFGGTYNRTLTVPTGTPIFFPVVNFLNDEVGRPTPVPVSQLRTEAAATEDAATGLFATEDGQAIANVKDHREISPVFSYTLPARDNVYQFFGVDVSGTQSPAVSDGYWIMLKPLGPGQHVITFGGSAGGIDVNITYHLIVAPKGQLKQDAAVAVTAGNGPFSRKAINDDLAEVLQ